MESRNRSRGIDFAAYVALRAGTPNRVVVPSRQAGNRFLGSLKGLQIRALFFKVTNDPASAEPTFKRVKQQSGMRQTWTYHVSFFGEPNRAWVVSLDFFQYLCVTSVAQGAGGCLILVTDAVFRIRDVYPGYQIRIFSIPDPGYEFFPSGIPDRHQRI